MLDRIIVQSKAVGMVFEKQFFLEIQEKILEGYRIADNNTRADVSMRNFKGRMGRVVLYKEDVDDDKIVDNSVDQDHQILPNDVNITADELTVVSTTKQDLIEGVSVLDSKEQLDISTPEVVEETKEVEEEEALGVKDLTLSLLEQVTEITGYKELKSFAKENSLDIPDNLKNPKAIKNYLVKLLKL